MKTKIRRIGVLTGGGDCPGLNAVIRAVVKTATDVYGMRVTGIEDGFEGLIRPEGRTRPRAAVSDAWSACARHTSSTCRLPKPSAR